MFAEIPKTTDVMIYTDLMLALLLVVCEGHNTFSKNMLIFLIIATRLETAITVPFIKFTKPEIFHNVCPPLIFM